MSETPAEAPAQEQPAPAEEAPVEQPKAEEPKADETDWKAEARKWETRAKENKTAAEKEANERQSTQSTLDAIAKALGLKSDDAPNPEKLAEQLTAEQQRAREAQVQLAVYRNAAANEANADALLDSASFLRTLADVDPNDAEAVSAAIKTAVEANPRLKAVEPSQTPPSFGGGPRKQADRPDPGPGLARMRDAYAQNSK